MQTFVTAFGLLISFCIALLISSVAQGEDWPAFRGPTGLGYSQQTSLPIKMWGCDFVMSPEPSVPFAMAKIEVSRVPFE